MNASSRILATLLLAVTAAPGAGQEPQTTLEPDAAVQAAIAAFMNPADEAAQKAALATLRENAGQQYRELIPQLVYYSWKAESTRDGMALGVIVERLRIREGAMLRAVVPLLETNDAGLRRELAGILAEYEKHSTDAPPSFAAYHPFLAGPMSQGEEPPPGLVRHLYETDAGTALLLIMRVERPDRAELRGILWAEHEVRDTLWKRRFGFLWADQVEPEAAEQLDMLSLHPRWWARLYAAQIMQQHAAFREPGAIERLAHDAHPLVKAAARPLLKAPQGARKPEPGNR